MSTVIAMSNGAIAGIIIGVFVVLAGLYLAVTARRDRAAATGLLSRETVKRDRSRANPVLQDLEAEGEPAVRARDVERAAVLERKGGEPGKEVVVAAKAAPPAVPEAFDEEAYGVNRRQFMNRSVTGLMVFSLSGFGAALIAFLWPGASSGFGSKIKAGGLNDILVKVNTSKEPYYVPEGRFYINPYPKEDIPKAKKVYAPGVLEGMEAGVVALYQKCVHLGCRVPWCKSSQWFECPCHGSKYNRVGEKKGGPAPRGLDRFAVSIDGGQIIVDTKTVILGPAIGTNTTGQEQEGPHCA
jgi:cytochrome b6-f complex iron-sulfur subunit